MRFLASLLALLLVPLLAAALLVAAALQAAPLVSREATISPASATISPASVAEARGLLARNDPRQLRRGDERTALIPATLIDEALNHLASRNLRGRGAFVLVHDAAEVSFSVAAPGVPGPRYLNLRMLLKTVDGLPRVASASIGALPIPSALAEWLIASAIDHSGLDGDWRLTRQACDSRDRPFAGCCSPRPAAWSWSVTSGTPGCSIGPARWSFPRHRWSASKPPSARW